MYIALEINNVPLEIEVYYSDRGPQHDGVSDALVEGATAQVWETLRASIGKTIKMTANGCSLLAKLHYVVEGRYIGYSVIKYV